ncbi:MAG: HK97 family phage prohead protease [Parvularcula sp.]|jgi:HK97 family phage prohead protease|nr:HK97 family phage prohead protease [Parvularcula sp.]
MTTPEMKEDSPYQRFVKRQGALSIKKVDPKAMRFSGYLSVFGVEDSYKEIVQPGAFDESLVAIKASGRPLPVLWQHWSSEPIGFWDTLEVDDVGLRGEAQLVKEGVPRAIEAMALIEAQVVSGISIGYWVRASSKDEKTGIRFLEKLDLVEASTVTFPANDEARIDDVKRKLANGELPDIRSFERFLREVGFSHQQAKAVSANGLSAIQREAGSAHPINLRAPDMSEVAKAFEAFEGFVNK